MNHAPTSEMLVISAVWILLSATTYTIAINIPQFYLKRFTDNNGYLHIYDIAKNTYFRSVPKDFGYENYLYETRLSKPNSEGGEFLLANQIEDIFAEYEGHFDTFLKKLDKICTHRQRIGALILYGSEKETLCHLIANLFFRNPEVMKKLQLDKPPENFYDDDAKELLDKVLEAMGICNADELAIAAMKKAMLTDEFDRNNIRSFVEEIKNLRFTFMLSSGIPFLTSSLPVYLGKDSTIPGEDKSCIFLALSSNLAVLYGNYEDSKSKNNRLAYVSDEVVDFFNAHQAKFVEGKRYIIGNSTSILNRYIVP